MCPPAGNFIGVIVQILILLGAVGLFLFGMKTMSEALQKLSGHRLRNMLTTMAGSPVRGIVASTAITALVQSSSAVTVMIVSFVNAGMLHLTQAIAMVMGANIGTTVTAWLVVLFGISFDIDLAAVPLIAFAAPLLLLRSERLRNLGNTLIGLALMLLAIHILRDAVTHFSTLSSFENYITLLRGHGHWSPLLFVLAGAAMTAVLQSSSATTALAIILCSTGVIPFKCAMALILGDNVGTTLTANIAATMTNTDGKRQPFHTCSSTWSAYCGRSRCWQFSPGESPRWWPLSAVFRRCSTARLHRRWPSRCSTPCSMSSTHCCWQASSRRRHMRSTG